MVFNETGRQETQRFDSAETATAAVTPRQVSAELRGPLETARRDRADLQQEVESELWSDIPANVRAYFLTNCDLAHLQNTIDYYRDNPVPPNLPSPVLESILQNCIVQGQLLQSGTENATEQARLNQNLETNRKLTTENENLRSDVRSKEGLLKLIEVDPVLQNLRGGALLDALSRRPEITENPQLAQYIAGLNATIDRMRSVVTDPLEQAAFDNILSSANLNLGAKSRLGVFADVMAQVDNSAEISSETKTSIRASIGAPDINTGTQAQNILRETRVDKSGRTVPVWTKDAPLSIREGVTMHSDANMRQIMRTEFGDHVITIDTTGWSGEVVGKYLEAMSFVHDVESFGGTGLFQSIYRIDFNMAGEEGFDAHKVNQILSIMGKWFGGFENTDGDVRKNGNRHGFIRYVVRLLNKNGTAMGFEESQADTDEVLAELGLHNSDGSPDWKQIDRVGDFARTTYLTGDADYDDLKSHLLGEKAK